jgi:hypothetical protein
VVISVIPIGLFNTEELEKLENRLPYKLTCGNQAPFFNFNGLLCTFNPEIRSFYN